MLVGFARNRKRKSGELDDDDVLSEFGCSRVFQSKFDSCLTDDVISYLREGDVLAVTRLDRLANGLEDLVFLVERLSKSGISIRVDASGIVPGGAIGDNFARTCCVLAEFLRTVEQNETKTSASRRRGRPHVLDPDTTARIASLLKEGSTDVLEVARQLKVSPATIYRHFRRQSGAGSSRRTAVAAKAAE